MRERSSFMQSVINQLNPGTNADTLTPETARAIAKDAYIYGFPLVDHYRIQHAFFADVGGSQYKGPWNTLINTPRVFTPEDTAIQTPNSDTPYSYIGLDLRSEPQVITAPPIEEGRYFCIQLIDAYTHNFDYIGTRTTGNGGGKYLIAGPSWQGEVPSGVTKVIRSETDFVYAFFRTQLFNPADIENVKRIQASYKVEPLSSLAGAEPVSMVKIDAVAPLSAEEQKTSIKFFNVLNFVLKFCSTHPSETELRARFAQVGFNGSESFDVADLPAEIQNALSQGIADAWEAFADVKKAKIDTGQLTSGDVFGTREYLKNDYLPRMVGAVLGIYGNSKEEAIYPVLSIDSDGEPLSGSNNYTLRFAPDQMPPVRAFWSLTMYKLPESLLVANPLNRYLLNSPMMDQFVKDQDGGLTFYIQASSPGHDKEPNWLPAPPGPFITYMRLYSPKSEALDGRWKPSALTKVS
jgi:hypothetical protein